MHTRLPGGGPNISLTRQLGLSPEKELEDFLNAYRLTRRFDTWAGIDLDGKLITNLQQIDRMKASHF